VRPAVWRYLQGFSLPAEAPVQFANFIYSRNKRIPCVLYPTRKQISGEITMPTPKSIDNRPVNVWNFQMKLTSGM
jgi:hypothetical protein